MWIFKAQTTQFRYGLFQRFGLKLNLCLQQNLSTEENFDEYMNTKPFQGKVADEVKICSKCNCYQYGKKYFSI